MDPDETLKFNTFELRDGWRAVVEGKETVFHCPEGDVVFIADFRVKESAVASAIRDAWDNGNSVGFRVGKQEGRREIIETVHELLGVNKIAGKP